MYFIYTYKYIYVCICIYIYMYIYVYYFYNYFYNTGGIKKQMMQFVNKRIYYKLIYGKKYFKKAKIKNICTA